MTQIQVLIGTRWHSGNRLAPHLCSSNPKPSVGQMVVAYRWSTVYSRLVTNCIYLFPMSIKTTYRDMLVRNLQYKTLDQLYVLVSSGLSATHHNITTKVPGGTYNTKLSTLQHPSITHHPTPGSESQPPEHYFNIHNVLH